MESDRCLTLDPALLPREPAPASPPRAGLSPGVRLVLVVLAATSATLLTRMLLSPILQDDSAFLASIIAVMLGSWYGGFRGGILATALSAAAAWFLFLRPYHLSSQQNPGYLVQIILFLLIGVLVSVVNEAWHRAKRRLTAHEEFLSTILEATPTGVVVLDAEGAVTFVNSAAAALFGLGRGLLVGRSCSEIGLIAERGGAAYAPSLGDLLTLGASPSGVDLIVEDAAATRVGVQVRVTRIPTAGQMPGGVLLSLQARETLPVHV